MHRGCTKQGSGGWEWEEGGSGHVQMVARVYWGSARRGAVNGSRGAGQKCRVRSKEAKMKRGSAGCSARGK